MNIRLSPPWQRPSCSLVSVSNWHQLRASLSRSAASCKFGSAGLSHGVRGPSNAHLSSELAKSQPRSCLPLLQPGQIILPGRLQPYSWTQRTEQRSLELFARIRTPGPVRNQQGQTRAQDQHCCLGCPPTLSECVGTGIQTFLDRPTDWGVTFRSQVAICGWTPSEFAVNS